MLHMLPLTINYVLIKLKDLLEFGITKFECIRLKRMLLYARIYLIL